MNYEQLLTIVMPCYAIIMLGYYRVINYQRILLIQGHKKKHRKPQTVRAQELCVAMRQTPMARWASQIIELT